MKTKVTYEWIFEELDEDGNIVDCDFSDTLTSANNNLDGYDFGLVRNEGNEVYGITDRYWAYVKDGKLPEYFQNGGGHTIKIKVPQKYHKELEIYFKQKSN